MTLIASQMKFFARQLLIDGRQRWAFILLDSRNNVLCNLAAPEDTITDWHAAWRVFMEVDPCKATQLLHSASFPGAALPADVILRPIFMRVIMGLGNYLCALPQLDPSMQATKERVLTFLDHLVGFKIRSAGGDDRYHAWVYLDVSGTITELRIDSVSSEVLQKHQSWAAQIGANDNSRDFAKHARLNIELIRYAIDGNASAGTGAVDLVYPSFMALCLALVSETAVPAGEADAVHQLLIQGHDSPAIARSSLGKLLRSVPDVLDNSPVITRLLHNMQGEQELNKDRIADISGQIAEHYLDRYQFIHALKTWRQVAPSLKDPLLNALISLLEGRKGLWLVLGAILAAVLAVGQLRVMWQPDEWLRILLLITVVGAVVLALLRGLSAGQLPYGQLFLPRLLGAIVVGLSTLVLSDLPYEFALTMPCLSWLLLVTGVYTMSYFYIYGDVYETIRYGAITKPRTPLRMRFRTLAALRVRSETQRIASWILALGTLESLLVTLPVSGLVLAALQKPADWETSFLGWFAINLGVLQCVIVPALLLLWASLALFIGSFVQLLWQGGRITGSRKISEGTDGS